MPKRWLPLQTLLVTLAAWLTPSPLVAQTVWCGPSTSFVQPAPGVADVLSPRVALNRSFSAGLYNSAVESGYSGAAGSPAGTEWAFGTAADRASLTFRSWREAVSNNPPAMVGRDMVVHLVADDVYLDVRFTAWAQNSGAGSRFSYVRSTPGACGPQVVPAVPALPATGVGALWAGLLALAGAVGIARRRLRS